MHEIVTVRLRLRLMSEEFLEASLRDDVVSAEAAIGSKIPPEWLQRKAMMAMRLQECRSDPEYAPWSLRAIHLKSSGAMIGHIVFHTRPNPDYLRRFVTDGIEVGYTVFSEYRRRGYAEEAVRGMIGWAVEEAAIRHFVASISPTNVASLGLARKLGFVKVGEHQDSVDGLEEVYVLTGDPLARLLAAG